MRGRVAILVLVAAACLAANGSPPDPLAARTAKVRAMLEAAEFPQVLEATQTLLSDAEVLTGADSDAAADAIELRLRAMFEAGAGDNEKPLVLANRGLAIKERLLGADDPGIAAMLEAHAMALIRHVEVDRAKAEQRRALAIREKASGPDSIEVVRPLLYLAGLMAWNETTYEEAARLATRAEAIVAHSAERHSELAAEALTVKGSTFEFRGKYAEASACYEKALQIQKAVLRPGHPGIGQTLRSLGDMYLDSGDFVRARENLEQAAPILEKTFPDSRQLTMLHWSLGAVQAETGDLDKAIATMSQAVAGADHHAGPKSMIAAISRNRLAVAYLMAGEFTRAQPYFEQALAVLEEKLGLEDQETVSVRNNLGFLMLNLGRYDEARRHLEQAYAESAKAFAPNSARRADLVSSLADLELQTGNFERARAAYAEVQAIRLVLFGPEHPAVARGLNGLARVDLAAGQPEKALDKALQAERIARTHFQSIARSLTEREALSFEAIRTSGLDLAITALVDLNRSHRGAADQVLRVWDALVSSRAMVLDEMTARRRALIAVSDETTLKQVRRMNQARDRLARLIAAGPGDSTDFTSRLKLARADEEQAERGLAEVSQDFRRLHRQKTVGLAEVLRALPAATALVGFVHYDRPPQPGSTAPVPAGPSGPGGRDRSLVGEEAYAAFVAAAGSSVPTLVPLGPAAPIQAAIRSWKEAAAAQQTRLAAMNDRAAEQHYRTVAEELRRLVWDPIEPRLAGADRVLIVPDGALGLISFATLPSGADRYLVETGPTIHYLSAERDAAVHGETAAAGLGILALGGPDFDASPANPAPAEIARVAKALPSAEKTPGTRRSACPDLVSARFQPLPGARLEAEEIASLWTKGASASGDRDAVLVRVGALANEAAVKLEAPGRRIVHLATHAFVAGDECASSMEGLRGGRLALAEQDMLRVVGDNPLLLFGLALAGANRREQAKPDQDDGILTGEEIASLDFTGTQWVVLSGCDTGVGAVQNGEGILGLRRAFETAGAQTLIMSLWPVEDEVAREWMRELYSERLSGKGTAEAVRGADLAILEARRKAGKVTHPFFWDGFVATGGWR